MTVTSTSTVENRVVVFDLPFPLRLNDFDVAGEIYVAGSPPAWIGVHRQMNDRGGFVTPGALKGGDPYGRASFSGIQVRFHVPTAIEVAAWNDNELLQAAVARTNRLVEHYRDVSGDPLARPVSWVDLVHFKVITEDAAGERRTLVLGRGRGPLVVGHDAEEEERERIIRERLHQDQPPPIHRTIELDIAARLMTGEGRTAVIEAGTLFESWLRPALEAAFAAKGDSEAQIEARFKYPNGRFRGIANIVVDVVEEATGYSGFAATPEYAAWNAARELRNEIVHRHRVDVSAQEARHAVDAIFGAILRLRSDAGLG